MQSIEGRGGGGVRDYAVILHHDLFNSLEHSTMHPVIELDLQYTHTNEMIHIPSASLVY